MSSSVWGSEWTLKEKIHLWAFGTRIQLNKHTLMPSSHSLSTIHPLKSYFLRLDLKAGEEE